MKIGEFADQFHISQENVRYYMKLGLLLPRKRNAQYDFGEDECRDLKQILKMKQEQFSLEEIRRFLEIRRVSIMVEPESLLEATELLEVKRTELELQIQRLQEACRGITEDIRSCLRLEAAASGSGFRLRLWSFWPALTAGENWSFRALCFPAATCLRELFPVNADITPELKMAL